MKGEASLFSIDVRDMVTLDSGDIAFCCEASKRDQKIGWQHHYFTITIHVCCLSLFLCRIGDWHK